MADERVDIIVSDKVSPNISKKLKDISKNARTAHGNITNLNRSLKATKGSFQTAATGFRNLIRYAKIYISLRLAKSVLNTADAFNVLQNKIRNVSETQEQLNTLTEELFTIARNSRTSVLAVSQAYQRFDLALEKTGASQRESLELTETLTKALTLSGATTQETASAMLQLSQAFNEGVLRGQEFRILAQTTPALLNEIAKSMGVTRGELKSLAAKGKIDINVLREAFRNLKDEIDKRFAETVPTLSQSFTVLGNTLIKVIGGMNKGLEGTESLSGAILKLSDYISGSSEQWILYGKIVRAELDSWQIVFSNFFKFVIDGYDKIFQAAELSNKNIFRDTVDLLKLLPSAVNVFIKFWISAFGTAFVEISSLIKRTWARVKAYFDSLVRQADITGKTIVKLLNPKNITRIDTILAGTALQLQGVNEKLESTLQAIEESKTDPFSEKNLKLMAFNSLMDNALKGFKELTGDLDENSIKVRSLREEYEELLKTMRLSTDPNNRKVGGLRPEGEAPATPMVAPTAGVQKLIDDLSQRRELFRSHYDELQADAIRSYENRQSALQKALGDRMITLGQFQDLSNESWRRYQQDRTLIQKREEEKRLRLKQRMSQMQLQASSSFFSSLAALEEGSNRRAIKRRKAFAIASAVLDTYAGANKVWTDTKITSTYAKFAMMAAVIARGLANVSQIRNAGNYANGGIVAGSSFSGDNMTANVNSREMILNMSQQRRLFEMANGAGGSGNGNVTIINQTSTPVEAESRTDEQGNREIVIREAVARTKQELTNEANIGGGTFVPALKQNFGLNRQGI